MTPKVGDRVRITGDYVVEQVAANGRPWIRVTIGSGAFWFSPDRYEVIEEVKDA